MCVCHCIHCANILIVGPGRTKAMLKELTEKMKAIEEKYGQLMQLAGVSSYSFYQNFGVWGVVEVGGGGVVGSILSRQLLKTSHNNIL